MSGTQSVSGDPYSLKTRSKWQVAQNIVTGKSSNTIQRMLFRKMLDLRLKCHHFCLGSVRPVYDLILVPHVIKLKPVSLASYSLFGYREGPGCQSEEQEELRIYTELRHKGMHWVKGNHGRLSESPILRTVLSLVFLPRAVYFHLPGPQPMSDTLSSARTASVKGYFWGDTTWRKAFLL